jgi:glutamate dehydrogenase (NAD(P)+)
MGWTKDEIGRATGLSREIGGIPLDDIAATGFGLVSAVVARVYRVAAGRRRVAVRGFGSVGKHAARFLAERGAVLVAAGERSQPYQLK